MKVETPTSTLARIADFLTHAAIPADARDRAAAAVIDTVGVTLAGASESAARIVQEVAISEGGDAGAMLGTASRASAGGAALANGTAAHALDFDDMCFVSLAHPSAPLVAASLAIGEVARASGRALLDSYVVGFEIEARLGRTMNPRHYQRGWHCTSTLGTIGAAAACARLSGLDAVAAAHALAIAVSEASGVKENFGSMVKPLHAGLAARNGVTAALLARAGFTASARALDGAQGFLAAMDSERPSPDQQLQDLGTRWEIIDTGIAVKLYPSCAATHPTLDAILELRHREGFSAADVDRVDVTVDSITPTVLIHPRPSTGLEAKFSMEFCVAAAIARGFVGIDSFDAASLADPLVQGLLPRVTMRVDPGLDASGPPLTQARVSVVLRNGRVITRQANGARGYPERPASDEELGAKFLACAKRTIGEDAARQALDRLRRIEEESDIRSLIAILQVRVQPDHS